MATFPPGGNAKTFSSSLNSLSIGQDVIASATPNTKGAILELVDSTEAGTCLLKVAITRFTILGGAPTGFLLDILIGDGGNEINLVEGIHVYSDNSESSYSLHIFDFPIAIASEQRISARLQSSSSDADSVGVVLNFLVPSFEAHPGYGQCVSLGVDAATTNSTILPDPGVSIHTKGAWTEIEASSQGYHGFTLSMGSNNNNSMDNANWLFDVGVGSAGNEEVVASNIYAASTSSERCWNDGTFYGISLAEGERIAIRCQSDENNATDRLRSVVFHGLR